VHAWCTQQKCLQVHSHIRCMIQCLVSVCLVPNSNATVPTWSYTVYDPVSANPSRKAPLLTLPEHENRVCIVLSSITTVRTWSYTVHAPVTANPSRSASLQNNLCLHFQNTNIVCTYTCTISSFDTAAIPSIKHDLLCVSSQALSYLHKAHTHTHTHARTHTHTRTQTYQVVYKFHCL